MVTTNYFIAHRSQYSSLYPLHSSPDQRPRGVGSARLDQDAIELLVRGCGWGCGLFSINSVSYTIMMFNNTTDFLRVYK